MARGSASGAERRLAEDIAVWGSRTYPSIAWEVDPLDGSSANLVARASLGPVGPELALYGHLDTSLTGDAARDFAITGEVRDAEPFAVDAAGRALRGLGIGVAKAPSAAAIVAFAAACAALRAGGVPHRLTLLLAAGGTHRAAPPDGPGPAASFGRGVRHALAAGWRPSAVLNVKGGPRGVLHEEPASAYLRVRVRGRWSAALMRASEAPLGGLARQAGAVLDAIEGWRRDYLAAHPPCGQLASEIAIGAIRSGSPEKPDLLPGILEVFLYAVLLPDADPVAVAHELAGYLGPRLAELPGRPAIEVEAYASAPGGSTDPEGVVVRLARAAWAAHCGIDGGDVRGWTGATDGGIFLAAGIPTVRVGPIVSRDPHDPRVESVSFDELLSATRAYVEIAVGYFCAPAAMPAAVLG